MFAVAGRDGLLPTVSGFVHFKRLTPVVPIIIEGTLGKVHWLMFRRLLAKWYLCLSRYSLRPCRRC